MKLSLVRRWRELDATIGTLDVDGVRECFTLEDVVRTIDPDIADAEEILRAKIPGATAIPAGLYRIEMYASSKFGLVPHLLDVPGFDGILIHAGNTAADTHGCILVGRTRHIAAIGESRLALAALIPKIKAAVGRGEEVTIEVSGLPTA